MFLILEQRNSHKACSAKMKVRQGGEKTHMSMFIQTSHISFWNWGEAMLLLCGLLFPTRSLCTPWFLYLDPAKCQVSVIALRGTPYLYKGSIREARGGRQIWWVEKSWNSICRSWGVLWVLLSQYSERGIDHSNGDGFLEWIRAV